jgi:hypothetical protein
VRVPRDVAVPLLHNGGYVVHDTALAPVQDGDAAPPVTR